LLLFLFLWELLGTPIKWSKCRGGFEMEWLGYWLDYGRFRLGISEARAQWLVKWITETLARGAVLVSNLSAALGRLGFAAGVLEWDRPFLGPIYAWSATVPAFAYIQLPVLIRLILEHFRHRLQYGNRTIECRVSNKPMGQLFMTDAKAEDNLVVLGGWETRPGGSKGTARWFSVRVEPGDLPGLYGRAKPQHEIATWELLASLVAVMIFLPDHYPGHGLSLATGATDNQGNSYAVAKLLTAKYPLCIVLMELSVQLQDRQLWLDLEWTPREQNTIADDLTNEEFEGFGIENRIEVDISKLKYKVMIDYLARGAALYESIEARKRERKDVAGEDRRGLTRKKVRRKRAGLRETDPWG
jgi:hypothetical protein